MYEPGRSALGPEQRTWLLDGLASSTRTWRFLANPSVMAQTWNEELPEDVRPHRKVKLLDPTTAGPDFDQWDGYPAERDAVPQLHVRDHDIHNLVVLSGDVHVSLAIELRRAGRRRAPRWRSSSSRPASPHRTSTTRWAGDFARTSVEIERQIVDALPHWKWCDLDSHGYTVVELTPDWLRADWWFVDSVLERHDRELNGATWMVERGRARLVPAPSNG